MENYKEITVEKIICGWNVNDIAKIFNYEVKPLLPKELSFTGYDRESSEGIIVHLDECYMEDDTIPEFVKQYELKNVDDHYMYHCSGCYDAEENYYTVGILTTFDAEKRVIFAEIRNEDGELLFKINFVE